SFDYLIILKKQYSANLKGMYFTLRFLSFGVPIILILGVILLAVITFGFGGTFGCYAFPQDHSYGEQKVYRNLYIYENDCYPHGSGGFTFKKKFLFFEKDVLIISSTDFLGNLTAEVPPTGYISQDKDTIFITGKRYMPDHLTHIRVTILSINSVQIESVSPLRYPPANGEKVETVSYNKKNNQTMKELVQIHTDIFRAGFTNSRSLIFLAEGYRASDESLFYEDVFNLLEKLEHTFPFS